MWPDDKSVIHVMELAEGLMNIPVKRHLKILHEEVADDQRQW
jgi:hypothetical protein